MFTHLKSHVHDKTLKHSMSSINKIGFFFICRTLYASFQGMRFSLKKRTELKSAYPSMLGT
jgi:hypothetical protein